MDSAAGALWTGGASSRAGALLAIIIGGLVVGVMVASDNPVWPIAIPVALGVVLSGAVIFSRVVMTVQPHQIVVRLGLIGWPKKVIALSDVTGVEVARINALTSGLGLRRIRGAWAIVIRGGEAVRIHRRDAKDFVVTVNDAEAAVAAVARVWGTT